MIDAMNPRDLIDRGTHWGEQRALWLAANDDLVAAHLRTERAGARG